MKMLSLFLTTLLGLALLLTASFVSLRVACIGGKSFFGTGDVQVNSNAQLFKSFGSPFLI
jgi:hypothetical protein